MKDLKPPLAHSVSAQLIHLKSTREEIQKRTFQKWVNMYLRSSGIQVTDLFDDLRDGEVLIELLERLSGETLRRSRCVDAGLRAMENVNIAIEHLKSRGIPVINIDAGNIVNGNTTLTLGIIWIIILKFQIQGMLNTDNTGEDTTASPGKSLQHKIVQWLNDILGLSDTLNFTTSWSNGLLLNKILSCYKPDKVDMDDITNMMPVDRVEHAMNIAKQYYDVEPILAPSDLATATPDERAVLIYLALLFGALHKLPTVREIQKRRVEVKDDIARVVYQLEWEHARCMDQLADQWHHVRSRLLDSHDPPQGLNEIFLVSSRHIASQYGKRSKAVQHKIRLYEEEIEELNAFDKEIKRLKHLVNYVHAYRDSLAKVDIYKHGNPNNPVKHDTKAEFYADADYDIPIINSVSPPYYNTSNGHTRPLMEDSVGASPKSKRKINRPPVLCEESLGLSEKSHDSTFGNDDGSRPYLKTNLHRGSMCRPPPKGFRDLLLDMSDEEVPWQIASVKREVEDIDIGDVDPSDPVFQIVQRRQNVVRRNFQLPPDPHVQIKKQSHREYYAGSSLVMEEDSEGSIMMASDKKARRYNKFRRQHLVQSLDQVEEEDTRHLLESRMFVQDYEDYESVSSGSISIFGNSDEEKEPELMEDGMLEHVPPLLHQCVSVESLLSDIIDIADIPEPEASDKPPGSPIILNKNYDFEVHKTIVVTEVNHDDPTVQELLKSCTGSEASFSESKTFSSQCTVWLRPEKQKIVSPVGDPKIYSADVTCMYGGKAVSSEITPGKEMSILFHPHSPDCPVRSATPDGTKLKLEIIEKTVPPEIPSPDKQIHITYCSSLSPTKKASPANVENTDTDNKIKSNNYGENDPTSESMDTSISIDSGVDRSLNASRSLLLEKASSPQDSGICSPSMAIIPKASTSPSHSPILERDRVQKVSGSSSEGIEHDYPISKEKQQLLEQIPESSSPGIRSHKPKVFSYAVNNKAPKAKRRKRQKAGSPVEIPFNGASLKESNSSPDKCSKSSPEEGSLIPPSISDDTESNEKENPTSESVYSVGEVPNTPDYELEFSCGEDLIFDDTEEATYEYVPVYKAMLEIFDAAISDKEDQLTYLRDSADSIVLERSFSECYDLLPHDYEARADVLNESLSEDSDSPATSRSWLTFGSKSSAGSSLEVADDCKPTQPVKDAHLKRNGRISKSLSPESSLVKSPRKRPTKTSVLPENYKERAEVLDESLSDDDDSGSLPGRWLSFSPRSSVKSSFDDTTDEQVPVMTPAIKYDHNQQRSSTNQSLDPSRKSKNHWKKRPLKQSSHDTDENAEENAASGKEFDLPSGDMVAEDTDNSNSSFIPVYGMLTRSILPENYQDTAKVLDESLSGDSDTEDANTKWLSFGRKAISEKGDNEKQDEVQFDPKSKPKREENPQLGAEGSPLTLVGQKEEPLVDDDFEECSSGVPIDIIFEDFDSPIVETINESHVEFITEDSEILPTHEEKRTPSGTKPSGDDQHESPQILCTYFTSNNGTSYEVPPPAGIEAVSPSEEETLPRLQSVQDHVVVEVEDPVEVILESSLSSSSSDNITAEDLYKDGEEEITFVPQEIIIQNTNVTVSGLHDTPNTETIEAIEFSEETKDSYPELLQSVNPKNETTVTPEIEELSPISVPDSSNDKPRKNKKKRRKRSRRKQNTSTKPADVGEKEIVVGAMDDSTHSKPSGTDPKSLSIDDSHVPYSEDAHVPDKSNMEISTSYGECETKSTLIESCSSLESNESVDDTAPIASISDVKPNLYHSSTPAEELPEKMTFGTSDYLTRKETTMKSPETSDVSRSSDYPGNVCMVGNVRDRADILDETLSDDSDVEQKSGKWLSFNPKSSLKTSGDEKEKASHILNSNLNEVSDISGESITTGAAAKPEQDDDQPEGKTAGDLIYGGYGAPTTEYTPQYNLTTSADRRSTLPLNYEDKADPLNEDLPDDSETGITPGRWFSYSPQYKSSREGDDNMIEGCSSPEDVASMNRDGDGVETVVHIGEGYSPQDSLEGVQNPEINLQKHFESPKNENTSETPNVPLRDIGSVNPDENTPLTIVLPQMWCQDISSSDSCDIEVECDSFDEEEVALSHQKTRKPLYGVTKRIPEISIEPANEEHVPRTRKKRRKKSRNKVTRSPHDTVPPNTPLDNLFSDNPFIDDADLSDAIRTMAYIDEDEALTSPIEIDYVDEFETSPMSYNKSNRDFYGGKPDSSPRPKKKSKKKKAKSPSRQKPAPTMSRSNSEPFNLSELGNDIDDETLDLLIPVPHQQSDEESTGFSPEKSSPFLSSEESPLTMKPGSLLEALGETEEEDAEMEEIEERKDRKLIATYLPMPLFNNQSSLEAHCLSPVFELAEIPDQGITDSKDDEESDEVIPRNLPFFNEPVDDDVNSALSSRQNIQLPTNEPFPRPLNAQGNIDDQRWLRNNENGESTPSPDIHDQLISPFIRPTMEAEAGADLVFGDVDMPYGNYIPEYMVEISGDENIGGGVISETTGDCLENETPSENDSPSEGSFGEVCEDLIFDESDSFVDEMIQVYEVVYENLVTRSAEKESQTENESSSKSTQSNVDQQDSATTTPKTAPHVHSATQCPVLVYADKSVSSRPASTDKDTQSAGKDIDTLDKSVQSSPLTPDSNSEVEVSDASSQVFLSAPNSEASSQADLFSPSSVASIEVQCSYEARDEESEADIRLSSVSRSSQSDALEQTSSSIQTDPKPTVNNTDTQCSLEISDSSSQADIRLPNVSEGTQSDAEKKKSIKTKASQAIPTKRSKESQSNPSVRDSKSGSEYVSYSDAASQSDEAEKVRSESTDMFVQVSPAFSNIGTQMSSDDENGTLDLICEDIFSDEEIMVELDEKVKLETDLKIQVESVDIGVQSDTIKDTDISSQDAEKNHWNEKAQSLLSRNVGVSPTSLLDQQQHLIKELLIEETEINNASPDILRDLSAKQTYISDLKDQVKSYMDRASILEERLQAISNKLDSPDEWITPSLTGLEDQIMVNKELQNELKSIGEEVDKVEDLGRQLTKAVPGQDGMGWGTLRSNFNNVSARVNDKKNFLQVESERFLKFKQDYNELGNWLQIALKDDLGGSSKNANGEEAEGNLQRAQSIFNTYKTRVEELGKLKYKLDNVIGYGRDLLMHLSPAAAQKLTNDLQILHTLWIKLDEEVRTRYLDVETALQGLLNLQDQINKITLWLDSVVDRVDHHEITSPDETDDLARHIKMYEDNYSAFESESQMLVGTKQLSHQLMGSLDASYENFINSQFESCNKHWEEILDKVQQKYNSCNKLMDIRLSLQGYQTLANQLHDLLKNLDDTLAREGYSPVFIQGLADVSSQITATVNMMASLEKECLTASEKYDICNCGLGIELGTDCTKCRATFEVLTERVDKLQVDLSQYQQEYADCNELYTVINKEILEIYELISELDDDTSSTSNKVELLKSYNARLAALVDRKQQFNDVILKLSKVAPKHESDALSQKRAEIERDWTRLHEESDETQHILDERIIKINEFHVKREEFQIWLNDIKERRNSFDVNQIGTRASLEADLEKIRAMNNEIEGKRESIEYLMRLGQEINEVDTDFVVDLDDLNLLYQNVIENVIEVREVYEESLEDWGAFKIAADESKACIGELKELLSRDDPIGPNLEQNYDDIYKQRKFMYDACQGSVSEVRKLSKKLVDKANPDGTAAVLSELNTIQDDWEDTGEEADKHEKRLSDALNEWLNFNDNVKNLSSWVNEADDMVSQEIPKVKGGEQLRSLNDDQLAMERQMTERDELYANVCEQATFYINNCDFPDLEDTMDKLDGKWKELEDKIPNRTENVTCLLAAWQDVEEGAAELEAWLKDAEVAIPQGDDFSVHSTGNVDDTATDLIRYKNFTEELRVRLCNLHDIKAKLDHIDCDQNSAELRNILGKLDTLDASFESVKDNTLNWRQQLEDNTNLWNSVSPGDDSMIAQKLSELSSKQSILQDTVANLADILNAPNKDKDESEITDNQIKQIKADTKIQTITLVSNRATSITDLHSSEKENYVAKQSLKVSTSEKISRSEREVICSRETHHVPYQVNLLLRRCYCHHEHGGIATFTGETCVNMCSDCGLCGSRPRGCRLQAGVSTCTSTCVTCDTCAKTIHTCYAKQSRDDETTAAVARVSACRRVAMCVLCNKNTACSTEWNLCTECEGIVSIFLHNHGTQLNRTDNRQTEVAGADANGFLFRVVRSPSYCSKLLKWLLALLLSYLVFYTFMLWLMDHGGCPGRSWRWWRHLSSPLTIKSHRSRPN